MDFIFFLLNPALVLSDALVILSFKASIWDFRLLISASRLLNFLASLESLFHLRLSCLLVKGASYSGCLTLVSCSCVGSQVDICGGGGGGPHFTEVSVISGPDIHYPEENLLIRIFSIESNLSIYAL